MKRMAPAGRSRAASWARRAGALGVPVLVLGALGHRAGIVPPDALVPVLALGFALALVAVGLAIGALVKIWNAGTTGAGAAIAAIFYAAPALALLGAIAVAALIYPQTTDVTTDLQDPPALEDAGDPAAEQPAGDRFALQAAAYPDIAPRFYAFPIADVYAKARGVVEARGWAISRESPPPSLTPAAEPELEPAISPELEAALAAKATETQSRGSAAAARIDPAASEDIALPEEPPETATLQAVAQTPVFGFADDVALRLVEAPQGTEVDMRSASRAGLHDLGQNARRIRRFFADLDTALQPHPNAPAPPSEIVPTAQVAPAGQ